MPEPYFDSTVECLPLEELIKLQQKNLSSFDITSNASASALYRDAWREAGVELSPITNRRELKCLPYINSTSIKQAHAKYELDDIVNIAKVRLWACTSGTTGVAKWVPYSDADLILFEHVLMRNFYLRGKKGKVHRVLAFTSPAPFIGDALTNLGILAQTRYGLRQEIIPQIIPLGLGEAGGVINLARQRRVDVLVSFPGIAMRMAEEISSRIKIEVDRQYHETKSLKFLLARLYFGLKKPRVQDALKFRYGLFSGESITPYREAIRKNYGLEPFEIYTFTEFPCLNMECKQHDGIHIWSDCCIPEIIPLQELEKEESIAGYHPGAMFLDEAPMGMQGEYVITTFSQALPLVRYRTSDLVQVVSTSRCGCGRTHPRIKVLHRLDDIINMGLIRFTIQEIENALAAVNQHGAVDKWQIRLERRGYKPAPVMIIQGKNLNDPEAFVAEVKGQLSSIKTLHRGLEAGLVCQPEILLQEKIKEETTATGKLKRVIYAANW
jgi:phenylacetate-CoA ligase